MDSYLLLRFVHITGFISLEVACLQSSYRSFGPTGPPMSPRSPRRLGTPRPSTTPWWCGGGTRWGVGTFLVFELGLGFLSEPWLAGMWAYSCSSS